MSQRVTCLHTEVPAFRLPARSRFGEGRARRREILGTKDVTESRPEQIVRPEVVEG